MQNIADGLRTSNAQLLQADNTQKANQPQQQAHTAPGLRSQSVETQPLMTNPFEPAHGNETDAQQSAKAAGAELLPLVTEGPSYDLIRSNFPTLYQKMEAWRRLSSTDLTPRDVIGMQLTANQLTREVAKLQEFVGIIEQARTLFSDANPAPGGDKQA